MPTRVRRSLSPMAAFAVWPLLAAVACSADGDDGSGGRPASLTGAVDSGRDQAAEDIRSDAATEDSGFDDTGSDAAAEDTGPEDAGSDTAAEDTGSDDAGSDTAAEDTGPEDAGSDAVAEDTGGEDTAGDPGLPVRDGRHRVLFVGNSYTYGNSLEALYQQLVAASVVDVEASTFRVAYGGYRFVQHAADAASPGSLLAEKLGDASTSQWEVVVLQEQSQIPGFPAGQPDLESSVRAAVELAGRSVDHGGVPVLLATWGAREGDSTNPGLYPDFATMTSRLEAGYQRMGSEAGAVGITALVAPAGRGWDAVRRSVLASGGDPMAAGSLFYRMFDGDGRHPAIAGSYAAAVAVFCTVWPPGLEPSTMWLPGGITATDAATLRQAACDEARRTR